MSSAGETSKSKKGFRGFLRDTLSRSSSHLPAPSAPPRASSRASFSSVTPIEAQELSPESGALRVPYSDGERRTALQPVSAQGAISAVANTPANPRPGQPDAPAASDSNETTTTIKSVVWVGLKTSLQGLRDNPGVFSHLSLAAGILLECFEGVETAARSQDDYEDLAKELAALSASLAEFIRTPTPLTKSISNVEMEIERQAKEIKDRVDRGSAGRFSAAKADEEDVVRRYRRIQSLFRQLQVDKLQVKSESQRLEHSK
ncbi:hypothetical protein FRC11_000647 [Ceratobasidium sp. 423]|nr:hypothetical protein FRC11_000647 [Ceratobasidium sp. 423]